MKTQENNETTAYRDGLSVTLHRSKIDGRLFIDIDTAGLEEVDEHPGGGGVPNIRIAINDADYAISPDGEWVGLN